MIELAENGMKNSPNLHGPIILDLVSGALTYNQQFINIYQAKDSDFLPADITVWHDAAHPSRIVLQAMQ